MRGRLAYLNTDHVNLMKDIEQKLYSLHEDFKNMPVEENKENSNINAEKPQKFKPVDVEVDK
jgi:hypothetical protein